MSPISRRRMLEGGLAGAVAIAAGFPARAAKPKKQKKAKEPEREVSVLAWGGYLDEKLQEAFEEDTGIAMRLSAYGSNEAAEMRLRRAGPGEFDLVFPSVDTGPNYYRADLLQPIDEDRLETDRIVPALWEGSARAGGVEGGKRYLVPFAWGTEGIAWLSEIHENLEYGSLSYGDLWGEETDSLVTVRPETALIGLVLHLDDTGRVPSDRGARLFVSEAAARQVLDAVLAWARPRRKAIGAVWRNATEAKQAFTAEGCTIGQVWDAIGYRLHRETDMGWRYAMPREGGLGWMDTMALVAGAPNPDEAYTLMNYLLQPEVAGRFSGRTGYASAAAGAREHAGDEVGALLDMAYPDEAALERIWWWPPEPTYLARLRVEYGARLLAE